MKIQYQMSNGRWTESMDGGAHIQTAACKRQNIAGQWVILDREVIIAALESGQELRISDNWYGVIRDAEAITRQGSKQAAAETVACACGHTAAKLMVLSTSRGSACPDCYDRMSN